MDLSAFYDRDGKKPFSVCDFIEVEVGTSKSIEVYLSNNTEFLLTNIIESMTDSDISIANMPNQLQPYEKRDITITFTPKLNRIEGLHSDIFFTGKKIIP